MRQAATRASSYSEPHPHTPTPALSLVPRYKAGVGSVIVGWDQGCLGMKIGEVRQLTIPFDEGYGDRGFPAWKIPPKATLKFEVELIGWGEGTASFETKIHYVLAGLTIAFIAWKVIANWEDLTA